MNIDHDNAGNALDAEIAEKERLAASNPADASLKEALGDLYLQKGLNERAATCLKEALQLSLIKNEFPLSLRVVLRTFEISVFDIVTIKDILSVLFTRDMRGPAAAFFQGLADGSIARDQAMIAATMRKLLQLDPSNQDLQRYFRDLAEKTEEAKTGENTDQARSATTAPERRMGKRSPPVAAGPSAQQDIKDTFLAVAKEKKQLESMIMEQGDTIKRLEKEKEQLGQSLKNLVDKERTVREKLLEYDILRNMEIADLKKKMETLLLENKQLLSEKDAIYENLDRDRMNLSLIDQKKTDLREAEMQDLAARLSGLNDERLQMSERVEKLTARIEERDRDFEEASSRVFELADALHHAEADRDEARKDAADAMAELDRLHDILSTYSEEVSSLKVDIDDLTTSIEEKIRSIDILNEKVKDLSSQLIHKDSELTERVPQLMAKINDLSAAIDRKMEENSLFAKELSDLNDKVQELNAELTLKDELLIELTEDYRKEADEFSSLARQAAEEKEQLLAVRTGLEEQLRTAEMRVAESEEQRGRLTAELEEIQEKLRAVHENISSLEQALEQERSSSAEKDAALQELGKELALRQDQLDSALSETAHVTEVNNRERDELNRRIDQTSRAMEELSHRFSGEQEALSLQLRDKDAALDAARIELERVRETTERTRNAHEAEFIDTLSRELSSVREALAGKEARLAQLESEIASERSLSAAVRDELASAKGRLEAEIASHWQECEALRMKLSDAESGLSAAVERTAQQDEARSALEASLLLLEEERLHLQEALARLRSEIDDKQRRHQEEIGRLQDLLREKDADISRVQSESAAEIERTAALLKEMEQLLRERDDSVDHTTALLNELKQENDRLTEEHVGLKAALTDLTGRLAAASAIEDEHALLSRDNRRLQETVQRLEQEQKKLAEHAAAAIAAADRTAQDQIDNAVRIQKSHADTSRVDEENRRLAVLNEEKDRMIMEATAELSRLSYSVESLRESEANFRKAVEEQTAALRSSSSEQAALMDRVARLELASAELREQKALSEADLTRELADARAELSRVAGLLARERTPDRAEIPGETATTPEVMPPEPVGRISVPARSASTGFGMESRSSSGRHTGFLVLLLAVMITAAAAYWSWYRPVQHSPAVAPVQPPAVSDTALSYDELFARYSRTSASGTVKLQAIYLAESLVRKQEAAEQSNAFDFSDKAYFKITVNSLKGPLTSQLVTAPLDQTALLIGTRVMPLHADPALPAQKTFLRRDEAVSTTYYTSIPTDSIEPKLQSVQLRLKAGTEELTVSWDALLLRQPGSAP